MTTHRYAVLLFSSFIVLTGYVRADDKSLTDLDLSTLMTMDVTITSAARRAQASSDAAAAVFVLTRENIRRSGATSIPELLRGVPGVQVAREANSRWAVTARGFNSRFANKLLVLIDGRSVYTQQYSGVAWEQQHVPLDEIERIEIVRGPGGALWGANAVNGIINIITRTATAGAGTRVAAGAGNEDHGAASLHYGGGIGERGAYRAYAEHFQRDSFDDGTSPWRHLQAGWRLDGKLAPADSSYTLQGDLFQSDLGPLFVAAAPTDTVKDRGGNVNLNWNGNSLANGDLSAQSSYSWRNRDKFGIDAEQEAAFDLNLQHNAARMGRHLLTLGGGFRYLEDQLGSVPGFITFTPERSSRDEWSLYAQDEIFFRADTVRLTFGAKIEEFDFTGTSIQPTIRGLWHIDAQQTLWAAVSRAVRTPSRFERGARIIIATIPGSPPVRIAINGSTELREEHLEAKEIGWRWRGAEHWSIDLALFENQYEDLAVTQSLPPQLDPGPPPALLVVEQFDNLAAARSRGAELSTDWIVSDWLRLQATGTWFQMKAPGVTIVGGALSGVDPKQSYAFTARMNLPRRAELDLAWRRVGGLPSADAPSYDTLGVRLGWRPIESLELSLNGDNLLDHQHIEYIDEEADLTPGATLSRSYFLRATWHSGH